MQPSVRGRQKIVVQGDYCCNRDEKSGVASEKVVFELNQERTVGIDWN